jgi:hypothetical protein
MRSLSNGMPRRIDTLNQQHSFIQPRDPSSPSMSAAPQTATFPNYVSSPLAPPQHYATLMSAPHHVTSFQNSYLRQDGGCVNVTGDSFPNVGAVLGDLSPHGEPHEQHHVGHDGRGLGIHTAF